MNNLIKIMMYNFKIRSGSKAAATQKLNYRDEIYLIFCGVLHTFNLGGVVFWLFGVFFSFFKNTFSNNFLSISTSLQMQQRIMDNSCIFYIN